MWEKLSDFYRYTKWTIGYGESLTVSHTNIIKYYIRKCCSYILFQRFFIILSIFWLGDSLDWSSYYQTRHDLPYKWVRNSKPVWKNVELFNIHQLSGEILLLMKTQLKCFILILTLLSEHQILSGVGGIFQNENQPCKVAGLRLRGKN